MEKLRHRSGDPKLRDKARLAEDARKKGLDAPPKKPPGPDPALKDKKLKEAAPAAPAAAESRPHPAPAGDPRDWLAGPHMKEVLPASPRPDHGRPTGVPTPASVVSCPSYEEAMHTPRTPSCSADDYSDLMFDCADPQPVSSTAASACASSFFDGFSVAASAVSETPGQTPTRPLCTSLYRSVSVDVRRTPEDEFSVGDKLFRQQSVPAASSYSSPGPQLDDKAAGPPGPAEKFACLSPGYYSPDYGIPSPKADALHCAPAAAVNLVPSPEGAFSGLQAKSPPPHRDELLAPSMEGTLPPDLGIPLDATEDQQATAAIIPPEPSFLEPLDEGPFSTVITEEPVEWAHPTAAEQGLASGLLGSAPENPVSWPVGSDLLLKSPQRFPESPKHFCPAESLQPESPYPVSPVSYPLSVTEPGLEVKGEAGDAAPATVPPSDEPAPFAPPSRLESFFGNCKSLPEAPEGPPEPACVTSVAQVEALGPLENSFLEGGHGLAALGQVEPVPWPGAFPAAEDDLDLGPFSLPELPLQAKDGSDVETEPVDEAPPAPPEPGPAGAPVATGACDLAAAAPEEQLVLPPDPAAARLPAEPAAEPSEDPEPAGPLEAAAAEAGPGPEGRGPQDSEPSSGPTPAPSEQRPLGSGEEAAEGPDSSAAPQGPPDAPGDGSAQALAADGAGPQDEPGLEGPPGGTQPEAPEPEPRPTAEAPKAPKVEEVPQRMTRNRAQMLANQHKQSSPPAEKEPAPAPAARAKGRGSEDDDPQAQHPRKRRFQRSSQQLTPQVHTSTRQTREVIQQTLAAIVDAIKLDAIEPYHSDRSNPYFEYLQIRKKIEEKRKILCYISPQAPQCYAEYVTYTGSYLLDGKPLSKLHIPVVSGGDPLRCRLPARQGARDGTGGRNRPPPASGSPSTEACGLHPPTPLLDARLLWLLCPRPEDAPALKSVHPWPPGCPVRAGPRPLSAGLAVYTPSVTSANPAHRRPGPGAPVGLCPAVAGATAARGRLASHAEEELGSLLVLSTGPRTSQVPGRRCSTSRGLQSCPTAVLATEPRREMSPEPGPALSSTQGKRWGRLPRPPPHQISGVRSGRLAAICLNFIKETRSICNLKGDSMGPSVPCPRAPKAQPVLEEAQVPVLSGQLRPKLLGEGGQSTGPSLCSPDTGRGSAPSQSRAR